MKISFECECLLLQRALLLFCPKIASSRNECDFIVSDRRIQSQKPLFLVGADGAHLNLPFSKNELTARLEEFYSAIQIDIQNLENSGNDADLEGQISTLVDNFKRDLIAIIKASRG